MTEDQKVIKVKGRALVIAPLTLPPQRRSGTWHAPSSIAQCTYLPHSQYSYTDPERMEGWVSPGPGCKEQLAHSCYVTARSQLDSNQWPCSRWSRALTTRLSRHSMGVFKASFKVVIVLARTECFTHVLVEIDGICVLHKLSHHLSLVVLHHQHFFWFCHPWYHDTTNLISEHTADLYWELNIIMVMYNSYEKCKVMPNGWQIKFWNKRQLNAEQPIVSVQYHLQIIPKLPNNVYIYKITRQQNFHRQQYIPMCSSTELPAK